MVADAETDPNMAPRSRETARARGYRSMIAMPMIREGTAMGAISVTRRVPGPFSEHHIDLLKTFADQAVIAIENVRLFNATKEALERQTVTADILKVISSSRQRSSRYSMRLSTVVRGSFRPASSASR
jgi:GAF domain-containing protein